MSPPNTTPWHIPQELESYFTDPFMVVSIAALFTMAKKCKPSKCPSPDECKMKTWHMYTTDYYSAVK